MELCISTVQDKELQTMLVLEFLFLRTLWNLISLRNTQMHLITLRRSKQHMLMVLLILEMMLILLVIIHGCILKLLEGLKLELCHLMM
ncbi:hypothetical protein C443_12436 [Haloarcula argentinensis DSM 12282]|nr:hypothetical protein C443_12436 [Haloarcula argentinensis DSM 12282]